jgi:hypothetical protein
MNRKQQEVFPIRVVVTDLQGRGAQLANVVGVTPSGDYLVEYWHVAKTVGGPEHGKRTAINVREAVFGWQIRVVEEVRAGIDSAVYDRSAANNSRLRKLALAKNAMREAVTA